MARTVRQALAEQLSTTGGICEAVDSVSLLACSRAQGRKRGQRYWL